MTDNKNAPREPLKIGDMVVTPRGRPARIVGVLPDHMREIEYLDDEGGMGEVRESLLTLTLAVPAKPWLKRTL